MKDDDEVLSHPDFWDERYSQKKTADGAEIQEPTHEWFRGFHDLQGFFQKFLFETAGRKPGDDPLILHLGSGDSVIPLELQSRGYKRQLCVDFSPKVVEMMSERWKDKEGIKFQQMDVRDMKGIDDKSIDVAFDKGTFDAMIHGSPWSPPDDVKENTGRYLKEVHRVLNDDGVFLWVTFRQPHFMRPLLDREGLFDLRMEVLGGKGGAFDYYGWVIKKSTSAGRMQAQGAAESVP